jgi:hypothetical protein
MWHGWIPLRFAELGSLFAVVDYQPATLQQTLRQFTFASGIGADAVKVRSWPYCRKAE